MVVLIQSDYLPFFVSIPESICSNTHTNTHTNTNTNTNTNTTTRVDESHAVILETIETCPEQVINEKNTNDKQVRVNVESIPVYREE